MVEPSSWNEFVAVILSEGSEGWIFRGQANADWPLLPGLARQLEAGVYPPEDWNAIERQTVGFFKERARSGLARPPEDDDVLGWLSLMQHYRAPTRLLDWTVSPFVGAYFVYSDKGSSSQRGALWALNADMCRDAVGGVRRDEVDHLLSLEGPAPSQARRDQNRLFSLTRIMGWSWPIAVWPPEPDARMGTQQAVFTYTGALAEPVSNLADKDRWRRPPTDFLREGAMTEERFSSLQPGALIKKVILPLSWKLEAIESLRLMGISAASLFPGLEGIGLATALDLETGGFWVE
jgi:hypothetical protein